MLKYQDGFSYMDFLDDHIMRFSIESNYVFLNKFERYWRIYGKTFMSMAIMARGYFMMIPEYIQAA